MWKKNGRMTLCILCFPASLQHFTNFSFHLSLSISPPSSVLKVQRLCAAATTDAAQCRVCCGCGRGSGLHSQQEGAQRAAGPVQLHLRRGRARGAGWRRQRALPQQRAAGWAILFYTFIARPLELEGVIILCFNLFCFQFFFY